MRADGTLPDDRLLHVCMLTYASDLTLLGSVLVRHDRPARPVQMASLDHAMWFHRPFRADEWLLYTCYSPTASGSRGLATGRFTQVDGTLVATHRAGGPGPARRSARDRVRGMQVETVFPASDGVRCLPCSRCPTTATARSPACS